LPIAIEREVINVGGVLISSGAKELLKMLAVSAGSDLLAGLGESIRGESPYEKMMGTQAGYMNRLMPDLYAESRGIPSMATRNLMRESNTDIDRLQQSYQASQARANPGMTKISTPARSGVTKFSKMKQESNRQILGQAQGAATNQLLGIGQNAQTMVGLAEQRREQRRSEFGQNITDVLGWYDGLNDPETKSRLSKMLDFISLWLGGKGLTGTASTSSGLMSAPEVTPRY
jgi:hypothetical protein